MTTIAIDRASAAASQISSAVSTGLKQLFGRVTAFRRRMFAKGELCALNEEQLRDVGIDPSEVSLGPVLRLDARTMTSLMSMR